jgi:hypothetical protein
MDRRQLIPQGAHRELICAWMSLRCCVESICTQRVADEFHLTNSRSGGDDFIRGTQREHVAAGVPGSPCTQDDALQQ